MSPMGNPRVVARHLFTQEIPDDLGWEPRAQRLPAKIVENQAISSEANGF